MPMQTFGTSRLLRVSPFKTGTVEIVLKSSSCLSGIQKKKLIVFCWEVGRWFSFWLVS